MANANQRQRRQGLLGFGVLLQTIYTRLLNGGGPDDQPNPAERGLSVGRRV